MNQRLKSPSPVRNPKVTNPNCCGAHCRTPDGLVKLYPLGGDANLILCRACWDHENRYRRERAREYGSAAYPVIVWELSKIYGSRERAATAKVQLLDALDNALESVSRALSQFQEPERTKLRVRELQRHVNEWQETISRITDSLKGE